VNDHSNVIARAASRDLTTSASMLKPCMSMKKSLQTHWQRPEQDFSVKCGRIGSVQLVTARGPTLGSVRAVQFAAIRETPCRHRVSLPYLRTSVNATMVEGDLLRWSWQQIPAVDYRTIILLLWIVRTHIRITVPRLPAVTARQLRQPFQRDKIVHDGALPYSPQFRRTPGRPVYTRDTGPLVDGSLYPQR
jgi:hypothetical protein